MFKCIVDRINIKHRFKWEIDICLPRFILLNSVIDFRSVSTKCCDILIMIFYFSFYLSAQSLQAFVNGKV